MISLWLKFKDGKRQFSLDTFQKSRQIINSAHVENNHVHFTRRLNYKDLITIRYWSWTLVDVLIDSRIPHYFKYENNDKNKFGKKIFFLRLN